jgi:hypothetical protein
MRLIQFAFAVLSCAAPVLAQDTQFKTAAAVLENYKHALGGTNVIAKVQSETVHGVAESSSRTGQSTFVFYTKPFKSLYKVTRADGSEVTSGFDGKVSWTIDAGGASIDKDTALDAVRRDTDLQYPLHQAIYFKKLELAGVTDFEGHHCYWLRGTTNWGKDNNQFYDVQSGLLVGYRFQSDDASAALVIVKFDDYKNFGGPIIATTISSRSGNHWQNLTYKSVSYDALSNSMFDLPQAVKALLN